VALLSHILAMTIFGVLPVRKGGGIFPSFGGKSDCRMQAGTPARMTENASPDQK
jgi:hypothetical protein